MTTKMRQTDNQPATNTRNNKSLVKEIQLLPANAYLLAVQTMNATAHGELLNLTAEQANSLSMVSDHLLELLGLTISRNSQDIQSATIVIE